MIAMADSGKKKVVLERVYVWQLPVRLAHWVIFFSIIILSATGYYMGNPFISVSGAARDHFVMGTVRTVHMYTAIVFTLTVLVRIYWLFAGNRYARLAEFFPISARRLRSLRDTFLYYSFARHHPDEYAGHNALAGASYLLIFVIYLIMIATGLALYSVYAPFDSVFRWFEHLAPVFYGLQTAKLVHHIGMWIVLIFAVVHVYFVFLSSIIEHIGTFDSIFSGYKFLPKRKSGAS